MTAPAEVRFPLRLPGIGAAFLSGWVFVPKRLAERPVVLLAVPGGTRTKAYYHLEIEGHPGYSFAEYVASSGHVVVALDHLGTGSSSFPLDPDVVTIGTMADALHEAAVDIRSMVTRGRLSPRLGALPQVPLVGLGHSMGGSVVLNQQERLRTYDAIALLGTPVVDAHAVMAGEPQPLQTDPDDGWPCDHARRIAGGAWDNGYVLLEPDGLTHGRYWEDVPRAVIDADEAAATSIPRMALADLLHPSLATDAASKISVPVLLVYGARDHTFDPHDEPGAFSTCRDVTLFVLDDCAHLHNFSGRRRLLWDRIITWLYVPHSPGGPPVDP